MTLARVFAALLLFCSLAASARAGDITITKAFAPKSLTPSATSAAAYLTISNAGAADRLLSVLAPNGGMAMVHDTKIVDDVAVMNMLEAVEVPAHGEVVMKQGGMHVMLMGIPAPLKEGDTLPLILHFEKAGELKVDVPVGGLTPAE